MVTKPLEFWEHHWNSPVDYNALLSLGALGSTVPRRISLAFPWVLRISVSVHGF